MKNKQFKVASKVAFVAITALLLFLAVAVRADMLVTHAASSVDVSVSDVEVDARDAETHRVIVLNGGVISYGCCCWAYMECDEIIAQYGHVVQEIINIPQGGLIPSRLFPPSMSTPLVYDFVTGERFFPWELLATPVNNQLILRIIAGRPEIVFDFNGGIYEAWGSCYYHIMLPAPSIRCNAERPQDCFLLTHFRNLNTGAFVNVPEPQLYDYIFVGWEDVYTGQVFSHEEIRNLYVCEIPWRYHLNDYNQPYVFRAIWTPPPPEVTLTFDANGGTPATQTLTESAGIPVETLPPSPTREGFVFAGWFNTPAITGGTQFTEGSNAPDTDTTYWARWNVILTFDGNGGSPATQTITRPQGTSIGNPLPPNPTRTGYIFAGWFTTPNATGGSRVTGGTSVPSTPTTYWARWITITIYYENIVSADSLTLMNRADDVVDEIKHLFLTNFGVNLVQRNPTRYEPGLLPGIAPPDLVDVAISNHNTLRFRFVHFDIWGFPGWGRPGFGLMGGTGFRLGDMVVTTFMLLPDHFRHTTVHEISHVFGAVHCTSVGCVMSSLISLDAYNSWCNSCRTTMHNYLSWLWLMHLSHLAIGGTSSEFSYFFDNPYYIEHLESMYLYAPQRTSR